MSIDTSYRTYLIDKWKESEQMSKEVGRTDEFSDAVTIAFFDKIAQPYFYWRQKK